MVGVITLEQRLGEIKWQIKRAEVLIWTFVFGTVILSAILVETIADSLFNLDLAFRTSIFYGLVVWACCYLVVVVFTLTRRVSGYFVAKTVGSFDPGIKEALMSLSDSRSNLVSSMIESRVEEGLKKLDYSAIFTRRFMNLLFYFLVTFGALVGSAVFVTGPNFPYHITRTVWPFAELMRPGGSVITNLTRSNEVVRGGALLIRAKVEPYKPAKVYMSYDRKEWFHLDIVESQAVIQGVRADFEYFIATDDAATDYFKVRCIEGPALKNIEFEVDPPPYTGLPPFKKIDFSIEAPQDSQVRIRFTPDRDIIHSTFVFSSGHRVESAEAVHFLKSSISFHLELTDKTGGVGRTPEYVIKMIPDRLPQVAILSPEKESAIGPQDKFTPAVLAKDDYGIKWFAMYFQKKNQEEQRVDLQLKKGEVFTFEFTPDQLGLKKGDSIIYYFEAADHYPLKRARAASAVHILHLSDKPGSGQGAQKTLDKLQDMLKDEKKLEQLGIKEKVKEHGTEDKGPKMKINQQMQKMIDALMSLDEQVLKELQVDRQTLQELKEAAKFERKEAGAQAVVQEIRRMEEKGTNTAGEFVKTQAYQLLLDKVENLEDVLLLIESRIDKKYRRAVENYFRNLARKE